jgi:hypothetical protein
MHRKWAAVLGVAAVALAGCGGDDDKGDENSLTKAQFIAQAGAICRDVKRAHEPYAEKVDALPEGVGLTRVAPLLEATLVQSRKGLARLRSLKSPTADRAQVDAYYGAADALLEAHAQLADAARTDDRAKGEKVAATTGALSSNERRLATAYGLNDCDNVF